MSELRNWYDRATVSDRITQPPFAELVARGRRRAHRARTVRLAGVGVFAALVATPLLTLPGEHRPDSPAGSGPPGIEQGWERHEITVSFLDLDYGVAHYLGDTCGEGWVSVTQDGGTSWSKLREHPGHLDQDSSTDTGGEATCVRPGVIPIARDALLIPGPPPPSVLPDRPSVISFNGGQTWREFEPKVRTADSVPEGVVPSWPCDEEQCREEGLGWHDSATGHWMVLENNPPGLDYDGLSVAYDGSIWVSGNDAAGDFHLAVSHDRGRTWLDRSPGADIDWLAYALLTVHDGDTAYLYPSPTVNSLDPDPFDLYRTTDGGETWHHMPAAQQFEDVVGMWTDREGGLVLDRIDDQYVSTDGGETFVLTGLPVWRPIALPGGGLHGWPRDRSAADLGDLYLSEDGLTWQPVEVPYYPSPEGSPAAPPSPRQ